MPRSPVFSKRLVFVILLLCYSSSAEDCYSGVGETYQGSVTSTKDGYACLNWGDSSIDAKPDILTAVRNSITNLDGSNDHTKCRNADKSESVPWCFTAESPGYGLCDIPKCQDCDSNPCQNGGTCQPLVKFGGYRCTCPAGWTGTNCETYTTASGCPNCHAGWTSANDSTSCYCMSVNEKLSWTSARLRCQAIASTWDLTYVATDADNDFIRNLVMNHLNQETAWMGLNDIASEDAWEWVSGQALQEGLEKWYRIFFTSEPNGGRVENCAGIDTFGMWHDDACTGSHPFICRSGATEHVTAPPTVPTVIAASTETPMTGSPSGCGCPSNMVEGLYAANASCYCLSLNDNQKSWFEAQSACRQIANGWEIASIFSAAENSFIRDLIQSKYSAPAGSSNVDIWMGLRDEGTEGTWYWATKTQAEFTNWLRFEGLLSEPNGGIGENCATVGYHGFWVDGVCSVTHPFICRNYTEPGVFIIPITESTPPGTGTTSTTRSTTTSTGTGTSIKPTIVADPAETNCPEKCPFTDWLLVEAGSGIGSCYCFSLTEQATWVAAKDKCRARDGWDLVAIHSEGENDFLRNKIATIYNSSDLSSGTWIGMSDATSQGTTEGNWIWTTGEATDYTKWYRIPPFFFEPNGLTQENCATIDYFGLWYSHACEMQLPFICKDVSKPFTEPPTTRLSTALPTTTDLPATTETGWTPPSEPTTTHQPSTAIVPTTVQTTQETTTVAQTTQEMSTAPSPTTQLATGCALCPMDFYTIGQASAGCYCLSKPDTTTLAWADADTNCGTIGANWTLARILTSEENAFIVAEIKKVYENSIDFNATWIQLNAINNSRKFTWGLNGPDLQATTHWYSALLSMEPSNQPGEECVVLDYDGFWYDTYCNQTYKFLCEDISKAFISQTTTSTTTTTTTTTTIKPTTTTTKPTTTTTTSTSTTTTPKPTTTTTTSTTTTTTPTTTTTKPTTIPTTQADTTTIQDTTTVSATTQPPIPTTTVPATTQEPTTAIQDTTTVWVSTQPPIPTTTVAITTQKPATTTRTQQETAGITNPSKTTASDGNMTTTPFIKTLEFKAGMLSTSSWVPPVVIVLTVASLVGAAVGSVLIIKSSQAAVAANGGVETDTTGLTEVNV